MTDRQIENRVAKIKALEAQKKELDSQIDSIKDELKAEMTAMKKEEYTTKKGFIVRFKQVISNTFDGKAFKAAKPDLYEAFSKQTSCMRFTITA